VWSSSTGTNAATMRTLGLMWFCQRLGKRNSSLNGGSGSSGTYSLAGTAGQPDAGTLTSGTYTLKAGFWGGILPETRLYLPLSIKQAIP